jgi:phytoene synthase
VNTHAELCKRIFKRGSRTYYYSSLWFPEDVRRDVFTLYSFVRVADDFVDSVPARPDGFFAFRNEYERALSGAPTEDPVIRGFVELANRKGFDPTWVAAFLDAMQSDLAPPSYQTLEDTIHYMFGSAEVVGLMMSSIMGLDAESRSAAQLLGRAMQYINFIRDVDEDLSLGRSYFPSSELAAFELEDLRPETARAKPEQFREFVQTQISRYEQWQGEAERGFRFIRRRYLVPIKTASELYKWTARGISADPFVVYKKKLKPSIYRVMHYAAVNSVALPWA